MEPASYLLLSLILPYRMMLLLPSLVHKEIGPFGPALLPSHHTAYK